MTCRNASIMAEEDHKTVHLHRYPGAEEALPWLPAYILHDAFEACADSISREDDYPLVSKRRSVLNDGEDDRYFYSTDRNCNYKQRNQPASGRKPSAAPAAQPPLLPSPPPHWKNYSKPDKKPKHPTNWAAGGPGMQAVFLVSGQRSCGTGVFLPRVAGTDVEKPKKPAFAPILLPSRVVQALNLNVHGLGSQIKPREHNNNTKGLECDRVIRTTKKNSRDMSSQICNVISQNQSSSPEIFLPKEWTY
ncbi:hypothetical protein SSX86_022133 [Deinandra increscens subsp. villosa]|uniref:Uncharacterized protein n=1 Tax=Deinandra increscens subsp. villosa TaxID=3103831 RepID=A0AAP0GNT4_9ASTR